MRLSRLIPILPPRGRLAEAEPRGCTGRWTSRRLAPVRRRPPDATRAQIFTGSAAQTTSRVSAAQRLDGLQSLARLVLPTLHFLTGMLGLGLSENRKTVPLESATNS